MSGNMWTQKRTVVALAVSLLTLAEIVDLTIVGVALPDIMGALGANLNEISLTMTSYIVVSAIFIPLTGIVAKKYGSKTLILASAFIFGIASILCGLSHNLPQMVIFRIIQGIGGAFLPAVSQAYIYDNFTLEERPKIMTFYSLCVVLGPVIGPVFGGILVEHMSWRWIFYVNVPICLIGFLLVYFLMDETKTENINADYLSFTFMAIGIGCLEFFLDEGNINNWFESREMVIILAIGLLCLIFFIWRGLLGKSVVDFRLFKDLNFNLACLIVFAFMVVAVMVMAYFPTLLQQGYGYPVDLAGVITAPRGMLAFLAAPFFIYLSKRLDARVVIMIGLSIFACSCWLLCFYSTDQNQSLILATVALQGIGLVGTFVVLSQLVFTGLSVDLTNDASGIFNFFRNIGNSVGTSVAATIISRQQQMSWNNMSVHIVKSNPNYQSIMAPLGSISEQLKIQIISLQIKGQSFIVANLDAFYISFIGSLLIICLPLFLAKPKLKPSATEIQILH